MNGLLILVADVVILAVVVTSYFLRCRTLNRQNPAIQPSEVKPSLANRILSRSQVGQSEEQPNFFPIAKPSDAG